MKIKQKLTALLELKDINALNFEPQDPFNFSIDVHAGTVHVKDFIYMLNLDRFLPHVLEFVPMIIKNMS